MCIALATSLQAVARCLHERVEFWFAVFALSAAWFYYPYCQTGPTLCIWRILLGAPCPGCGLTRGVCFLVHGKWVEAVRFNPLSTLCVGILLGNVLCTASRYLWDLRWRTSRMLGGRERWPGGKHLMVFDSTRKPNCSATFSHRKLLHTVSQ
jgi:hypothetical protein